MLPHRPEASSDILRAARILHLRIEAVQKGDYQPDGRFVTREVHVGFVLLSVPKGHVTEAPGDRFVIRVTQSENAGTRFTAVPGVWSRLDLDEGSEVVAFTTEEGASVGECLNEPACFRVRPAESTVDDVTFASEAGLPELDLAALLSRHAGHEARFGPLFAAYLVDRFQEVLPDREAELGALLRVLEAPALPRQTRFVLCSGVVGRAALNDPLGLAIMRLLVPSLFRLVALPEARDLHSNLVSTWIPNLVGLVGGMERQRSTQLFPTAEAKRAAETALLAFPDRAAVSGLLHWLES